MIRTARPTVLVFVLATLGLALAACAPESAAPQPSGSSSVPSGGGSTPTGTGSPTGSGSPTTSPTPTPTPTALPTDCRSILSDSVLAELEGTPLNDPGNGGTYGVQPDGSLTCLWRNPGADTTYLQTKITWVDRGPALDRLNGLVGQGYSCYTPSGGTRCEKSWVNNTYPVQDGQTLFWRDGIMIDTTYSNLAPSGYTDSIIAHIFP